MEDIRVYQPGDDVKNINWKLTAKTGKLHVNVFRTTKDVDFHIFLDLNINWYQLYQGKKISETVAYDLQNIYQWFRKKKASIKIFWSRSDKLEVLRVKKVGELLYPIFSFSPSAKYSSGIKQFLKYELGIKKRHVILIISDLLFLDNEDVKILRALSKFSEVFVHPLLAFEKIGWGANFDYLSFAQNPHINEIKDLLI